MNKINDYIPFEKVSVSLFLNDLEILKPYLTKDEISFVSKSKYLDEIVKNIEDIYKAVDLSSSLEKSAILENFLIRYKFLLTSNSEFIRFSNEIGPVDINWDLAQFLTGIYIPFFNQQLNYYTVQYLEVVNKYDVESWSEKLFLQLRVYLNEIITSDDFIEKLEKVEGFTFLLSNKELFDEELKLDNIDKLKEEFLVQTNETKIILQTINSMIQKIIEEIYKLKGEQ